MEAESGRPPFLLRVTKRVPYKAAPVAETFTVCALSATNVSSWRWRGRAGQATFRGFRARWRAVPRGEGSDTAGVSDGGLGFLYQTNFF